VEATKQKEEKRKIPYLQCNHPNLHISALMILFSAVFLSVLLPVNNLNAMFSAARFIRGQSVFVISAQNLYCKILTRKSSGVDHQAKIRKEKKT
jgi:hypothetical protein